ncbi:hypothetical protein DL770_010250 [Monosporascus sp. CRB-9-2]|nr:hypothetical protein DL770_010250 [Monosporascus sp. CRB-9-2]
MLKDGIYVPKEFDPTLFTHSRGQCAPQELFPEMQCTFRAFPGFTPFRFNLRRERPVGPRTPIAMQLIYTDGACSNNGRAGARAGVGFASCCPGRGNTKGVVSFPLERQGPDGRPRQPTSNRAELRAVIGALEWRNWYREGWEALVIATDSAYVAHGAATWISTWVEMEWRKADGSEVANKDLWKRLLFLFRQYAIHGCEIMVWRIPRELNTLADEAAVRALDGDTLIQWVTHRDPMLKVDTVFDFGDDDTAERESGVGGLGL